VYERKAALNITFETAFFACFDIEICGKERLISLIPKGEAKINLLPVRSRSLSFLFYALCSNFVWQRHKIRIPSANGRKAINLFAEREGFEPSIPF
jgi:hypothetical protein